MMKRILTIALLAGVVFQADAFSLLGRFKGAGNVTGEPWHDPGFGGRPQGLGYTLAGDIGGPMFAHEAYRWNIPTITYAYDASFVRYFGTNGIAAIDEAIAILNALPPSSQMSATLDEYPLDAKGENAEAAALGLVDLKSTALVILLEQMGLASPERFVFGLRGRQTFQNITNYSVVQMNYDPQTIQPSRYVNGVLYNYVVFDAIGPVGAEWASAVEWYRLDPLRMPYSSIAGSLGNPDLVLGDSPSRTGGFFDQALGLITGQYFRGLTRDDVGAIRFLLSTNNIVAESLLPTVVPSSVAGGGSPWGPVFGTNVVGATNVAVTNLLGTNVLTGFTVTAPRPGVDKITFQRVNFDSLLGTTFTPITNRYTDTYFNPTNSRLVKQKVARVILRPDIIFAVDDIGTVQGLPWWLDRTTTAGWSNNAAINTVIAGSNLGGPGIIVPGIEIRFSDLFPYFINFPDGLDSDDPIPTAWGSFDGSNREPVVYPIFQHPVTPELSLQYLRSLATRSRN